MVWIARVMLLWLTFDTLHGKMLGTDTVLYLEHRRHYDRCRSLWITFGTWAYNISALRVINKWNNIYINSSYQMHNKRPVGLSSFVNCPPVVASFLTQRQLSVIAGWQHMGRVPHPNYVNLECCVATVCHQGWGAVSYSSLSITQVKIYSSSYLTRPTLERR